jgi:hypothetical protein
LIAPFCVIIMMIPVYLQARADSSARILDYASVTLVLSLLAVFVAYLFAEAITSLMLITSRWVFVLQALVLASAGSAIGFVLFYVLSGQGGLWFEGGITGLTQMILSRKTRQKPRWYSAVVALLAGIVVFLLSLQVIDDARLVESGAALSTGLFTMIYTYLTCPTE